VQVPAGLALAAIFLGADPAHNLITNPRRPSVSLADLDSAAPRPTRLHGCLISLYVPERLRQPGTRIATGRFQRDYS